MTEPTIVDLEDPTRFDLLVTLGLNDIAAFAKEYYWQRRSWVTVAHVAFSLLTVVVWIMAGIRGHYSADRWLTTFGNSVLTFFILLPIHEGIHGLVYKIAGAADVRYGGSLKKVYAYAIAHRFVANGRVFAWVAAMPFIVINTALIIAALTIPAYRFILLGILMFHTAGTSGDCAMLNLLWLNRDHDIYTFDDANAHASYFYRSRL